MQGSLKFITAMRVSRCYQQVEGGVKRGWASMNVWTRQVKEGAPGGCRLHTKQARLDGDRSDKLRGRYRMQRLDW